MSHHKYRLGRAIPLLGIAMAITFAAFAPAIAKDQPNILVI